MSEYMSEDPRANESQVDPASDGFAVLAFLIRWRVLLLALTLLGLVLGGATGLSRSRAYRSKAVFMPQASDGGLSSSSLARAASQFDIPLPSFGGGQWGPAVYVSLLTSDGLLERVARDTVSVSEDGHGRIALQDLLRVPAGPESLRRARAVLRLRELIAVRELKGFGGVEIVVVSRWPSVSHSLAERLLSEVQLFVKSSRQSQASAEREFAERRAVEERGLLDESESRLRSFLEANRSLGGSPELAFERDRLQRDVALRQQIYASILQAREEARLREVRDTPVVTVVARPEIPVIPESRRTLLRGVVGAMMGAMIAVLFGVLTEVGNLAKESSNPNAQYVGRFLGRIRPLLKRRQSV